MRIGILGGSFDPIHNGHIYMALQAYKGAALDEVWLMPSNETPNKIGKMAPASDRIQMCEIAAMEYPFLKVSDFELRLDGISYTYRTISELHKICADDELFFIMGADSINYFEKWKNPDIISAYCTILVINRDDFSNEYLMEKSKMLKEKFQTNIKLIKCPKKDISSTEIRDNITDSTFCQERLHKGVYDYIRSNSLYTI